MCFAQENIIAIDSSPVSKMDIIFCQNVLIYFQRDVQHRVLDQLAARLNPGGLLVVGLGESFEWHNNTLCRLPNDKIQGYIRY